MARCSAGWKTTGAGSTTLPIGSLYSIAGLRPVLREVHVFNTTATAVDVAVRILTSAGTQGTGQTELCEDNTSYTPVATAFDTHSSTGPTITTGNLRTAQLGAAVGSGVMWTFGPAGIVIPAGTGNGIGVVPLGTGQICYVQFVWDE